jgi:hypothetical protein
MRAGVGATARARAAVLAGAAVLAASAAAVAPAAATAKTWTVHPGGKIAAMSGKIILTDTPTGAMVSCESSRMSGLLKSGSGLPGTGIGSFTTAVYSLCAGGPFGATLTAHGLPWRLNLTSYDQQTGVARGTISHVKIGVVIVFAQCTAVIKGTSGTAPDGVVAVSYASKTGTLKILKGGNLHWYHVNHCAGIVNNGDAATLSASYTVSPRQVITSP